jgi:hypothetical protein
MNEELNRFITLYGNQRTAAEAVAITPAAMNLLLHRKRDFSCSLVRRIKKVFPALSCDKLLEPGVIGQDSK